MTSASAKAFNCLLTAIAVALPLTAPTASGTEDKPYLVEHRAYTQSLEAGDTDAAATHARAAWQAAEKALGIHRLTAVFAYNYGRLVLFDDSENARAALRRTRGLYGAGVIDLPEREMLVYLKYAEFSAGGSKSREADDLRDALRLFEAEKDAPNSYIASIWFNLALSDYAARRFDSAVESAAGAEAAIRRVAPDNSRRLAEIILIGGISRLIPNYWRLSGHIRLAHREFIRARSLFPPQEDLESFDPLLAEVLVWDGAASAALADHTCGRVAAPCGFEAMESPAYPPLFKYQQDPSIECEEIEWLEKGKPHIPIGATRPGTITSVLVGFRLGDDRRVRDARILAEASRHNFGDYVLKAMTEWRAKKLPAGGPACYQNLTAQFEFMTAPRIGPEGGT